MSSDEKTSAGWLDKSPRSVVVALGVSAILAVAGWAETFGARSELAGVNAQLAAAGLEPSTAETLNRSIAAKQRELVGVENALVSFSAAAGARQDQVAKAAGQLARIETEAADASARAAEASALYAELEPKNRVLGRTVLELENGLTALQAAVGARRTELGGLIADVEENARLVAEATAWKADSERLTAAKDSLGREVVGLENQVVSLAAAVDYRRKDVAAALLVKSEAENTRRQALVEVLELRAEAEALGKAIDKLTAEREAALRLMVDANNRLVPAVAAVKARESQLVQLNTDVAGLAAENAALTERNDQLVAQLGDADQRLVQLAEAARTTARHLAAIEELLGAPTVQAALQP